MKYALIAALLTAGLTTPAFADGDAAKGEQVVGKCKVCHDIDTGATRLGPTLKGVLNRPVGSVAGYKYSPDILAKGAEGKVWDEATLATYLANPKAFAPATKMTFLGIKNPDDIANLIAFLKTKP